jgi:hypothetical protein
MTQSNSSTSRMLDAYIEQRVSPRLFLSSFFRTTPKSFHQSDTVQVDIKRGEPYIAVPVAGVNGGARKVEDTKFTNKEYTPPKYDLEAPITAWSTGERQIGATPFEDPNFRENARNQAFNILGTIEDMVRRGGELQCSQIFQTGKLDLKDAAGTASSCSTSCRRLRTSRPSPRIGRRTARRATPKPISTRSRRSCGATASRTRRISCSARRLASRFMKNAKILAKFDNFGLQKLQEMLPGDLGLAQNATLFGRVTLGAYQYRCWFYDDYYIDPQTNNRRRATSATTRSS